MYTSTHNLLITIHCSPPEQLQGPDHHTIISEPALQYEQWLPQWIAHLRDAPLVLTIPPAESTHH